MIANQPAEPEEPRRLPQPRLLPTPLLPHNLAGYADRERAGGDPIGVGGLPATRRELNILLRDLCCRLISAAGSLVGGLRLARDLHLRDTRSLRLLVAYGHVHHRLRAIVGIPGSGYCWGDLADDPRRVYDTVAAQARRMGQCWLWLATLYGRAPAQVELAQLVLGYDQPGQRPSELAALLAADGVGQEEIIDAMIRVVAAQPSGRDVLRRLGDRHRDVLFTSQSLATIRDHLTSALAALQP